MARNTLLCAVTVGLLALCPAMSAPESPDLQRLLSLAEEHSRQARDREVVETLSQLVDAIRNQPKARGSIRDSLRLLEPIHRKDPAAFQLSYLYAEFLFLADQYPQALRVLSLIGPQGGSNPDFLNLAAMCFAGLNDLPKASQALLRAIDLAPDRVDLLVNLAGLYQRAKNNEAAVMALEKAANMPSASPVVFFTLALSRFNLGDFPGTVGECKKTIGLDPRFDKAFLLMSRAYTRMAQRKEAIQALRRAGEINPACDQCRVELAVLLSAAANSEEPVRLLRQALTANPRNAEAHYQMGKLLSRRNRTAQAVEELQKAVTLDPDHDGAQYRLATLYRKQGKAEQAGEVLKNLRERKEKRRAKSQTDLLSAGADSSKVK